MGPPDGLLEGVNQSDPELGGSRTRSAPCFVAFQATTDGVTLDGDFCINGSVKMVIFNIAISLKDKSFLHCLCVLSVDRVLSGLLSGVDTPFHSGKLLLYQELMCCVSTERQLYQACFCCRL